MEEPEEEEDDFGGIRSMLTDVEREEFNVIVEEMQRLDLAGSFNDSSDEEDAFDDDPLAELSLRLKALRDRAHLRRQHAMAG